MKLYWRPVSLRTLTRALDAGWSWGSDPRNGRMALVAKRGTVFEFRSRPLQVRRFSDGRLLDL